MAQDKPKRDKKKLQLSDVASASEAEGTVSILALKSIPCPDCGVEHIFIELANGGIRPLAGHQTHGLIPEEGMSETTMEGARALICRCSKVFKVPVA